jgi:hypothetical protein
MQYDYLLAFGVAAIIAFIQLETAKYPHTNFLIRTKPVAIFYVLFYGVLGAIFYSIVVYTGIDMFMGEKIVKEPYIQAILVGFFSKGISDWNFFTLPFGDDVKPLGIKTLTEPIESTLLKKLDEQKYNSLKEYVAPVCDAYCKKQENESKPKDENKPDEKVLKDICNSIPAKTEGDATAYEEDLKNIMDVYDSEEAKVSVALEKYLEDFGRRSYDRVFNNKR